MKTHNKGRNQPMTTKDMRTLLERADPHLWAIKAAIPAIRRIDEEASGPLDHARYELYQAIIDADADGAPNPRVTSWLSALEAAAAALPDEVPCRARVVRSVAELRRALET